MSILRMLARLKACRDGASAIEFGLLGPMIMAMFLGVLAIGMEMKDYNAIRSVGYDVNRLAIIEYQKDNAMLPEEVSALAYLVAQRSPYNLDLQEFSASAEEKSTGISGAKKIVLTLKFTPFQVSKIVPMDMPTFVQTQSIIVPDIDGSSGGGGGDG